MRAHSRVALVSLAVATGGLAGCGSLDKLSDTTTGWLVSPEHPPAKIAPGEETSEPSAKEGESGTQTADTPSEKKDKPAPKPQRRRTAKALKKPAAPARAASVQPQTPEPKSVPARDEPLQHPWPGRTGSRNFLTLSGPPGLLGAGRPRLRGLVRFQLPRSSKGRLRAAFCLSAPTPAPSPG